MRKIIMVWFHPAVAACLAATFLAISPISAVAQADQASAKGGWNIKSNSVEEDSSEFESIYADQVDPEMAKSKTLSIQSIELPSQEESESELEESVAEKPSQIQPGGITEDKTEIADAESSLESVQTVEANPSPDDKEAAADEILTAADESSLESTDTSPSVAAVSLSDVNEGSDAESAELASENADIEEEPSAEQVARGKRIAAGQLSRDIEQQYKALRATLETEDAFSEKLGENYLGYGMLLRESGQYEEAIEAFINALHISKVNNGIYSLEQRPALKALFDTHYALQNTESYEDYLERILWVEQNNPDKSDHFSFDMLLMVGNQYIDRFLRRPVAGAASVEILLRAKHHLTAAVRTHGRLPLASVMMPYGELALVSFLESKIQPNIDKTASMDDPRLRGSRNLEGRQLALASYVENSFPRGEAYLNIYLKKAQYEESSEHIVRALNSLGDLNQLFGHYKNASGYYQHAWQEAQNLEPDHPLRLEFNQPVALPAFNYAFDRKVIEPSRNSILVPLHLTVDADGRVAKVQKVDGDEESERYFQKARRHARRLVFRPRFVDAEAVVTEQLVHQSRVFPRR